MKSKEEIEQLAESMYGKGKVEDYEEGFVDGYTQCSLDMANADNVKVTRFEVIDESGRVCTRHNCKVELSYQDDGRTLKVFLSKQD